jgi:hypothetical protein
MTKVIVVFRIFLNSPRIGKDVPMSAVKAIYTYRHTFLTTKEGTLLIYTLST